MLSNRRVCFAADAILLWFHMKEAGSSIQEMGLFSSGSPFLRNTLSGKSTTLMQREEVMELGNGTDFHLYQGDQRPMLINESHQYIMYFEHKGRLSFTEENNLGLNEFL